MSVDLTGGSAMTASTCSRRSPTIPRCASRSTSGPGTTAPSSACRASGSKRSRTSGRRTTSRSISRSPTGACFNLMGNGEVHDPLGADGRPRTLGAGPLSFELLDPFRHWRRALQRRGEPDVDPGPDRRLGTRARPRRTGCGGARPRHQVGRAAMGERHTSRGGRPRARDAGRGRPHGRSRASSNSSAPPDVYTSATRSTTSTVGACGSDVGAFVDSPRSVATFGSQPCSPAGARSACACIRSAPTASPRSTRVTSSRATASSSRHASRDAPWLRKVEPRGQDASVTLVTEEGTTRIEGETILSTCHVMGPPMIPQHFSLQQAIAAYRWDGETANGMLERSVVTEQSG